MPKYQTKSDGELEWNEKLQKYCQTIIISDITLNEVHSIVHKNIYFLLCATFLRDHETSFVYKQKQTKLQKKIEKIKLLKKLI